MSNINRRYIDKHWLTFLFRGGLALIFGWFILFSPSTDVFLLSSMVTIFLLVMGIIDASLALYNSTKKHGWVASIVDAAIDIIVALILLFVMNENAVFHLVIIACYTLISGVIDIVLGFVSTVDPTDRFIRILSGICGAVMGLVIFNAGGLGIGTTDFIHFFGAYLIIVGVSSLIYGIHNRTQSIEDKVARKKAAKKASTTRKNKK